MLFVRPPPACGPALEYPHLSELVADLQSSGLAVPLSVCIVIPVAWFIVQRLSSSNSLNLLPLAMGVAAVTPCFIVSPLVGITLSVALNIILLLNVQELSLHGPSPPAPVDRLKGAEAVPAARRSTSSERSSLISIPHLSARAAVANPCP